MAQKRMFSNLVIGSDDFLEMPDSSQNLYFHLSMQADDDGFVDNWKSIMRMTGKKEDDLKILIAKSFIIPFETGVLVIKHWKLNNYIQRDRYKETIHKEEKSLLSIDKNNVYNMDTGCIQNVSSDKNRLDKNSIDKKKEGSGQEADKCPPNIDIDIDIEIDKDIDIEKEINKKTELDKIEEEKIDLLSKDEKEEKLQTRFIECINSYNTNAISECISYLDDLPYEIINSVLIKTSGIARPNWNYAKKILDDYVKKGINTLEKIKIEQQDNKKSNKTQELKGEWDE